MTPREFRQEKEFGFDYFIELTSIGLKPNYVNIELFAQEYHKAKLNLLETMKEVEYKQCVNNSSPTVPDLEREGGEYYWVRTEVGKEIAFKRDSGAWEMHGIDCTEDLRDAILEVYEVVAKEDKNILEIDPEVVIVEKEK